MISLEGLSLAEKGRIVAREIERYTNSPFIKGVLRNIGIKPSYLDIFEFVTKYTKYAPERKDILYAPQETLGRVQVDCEDVSLLLGSLLRTAGYPVKVKLVTNRTSHIFPLVGLPRERPTRWIPLDATTERIGMVERRGYYPIYVKKLGGVEAIEELLPYQAYKIRYRITGIFEIIAVSTTDFIEGIARAKRELPGYEVTSINSGVSYDPKGMIVSIFIKVKNPLPIDEWNNIFCGKVKEVWGISRWLQLLNIRYMDHSATSAEKAVEEMERGIWKAVLKPIKYGAYVLIGYGVWKAIKATR